MKGALMLNIGTHRRIIMLTAAAVLAFVLAGCTAGRALLNLRDNDTLDADKGYTSVVFWRMRVVDRSETFHRQPRLFVYRPAGAGQGPERYDRLTLERVDAEGTWEKENGVPVYEALVAVQARPGEYLFKDTDFYLYTARVTNYGTMRKYDDVDREMYLTVPVGRTFTVASGTLTWLGDVTIEISLPDKRQYVSSVRIAQDDAGRESAAKRFREAYPGLYRRFNRNVEPGRSNQLVIENFYNNRYGWDLPVADKAAEASFESGFYELKSRNDACHVASLVSALEKRPNADVDLVSSVVSGDDTAGFGLWLGVDRENAYAFLASGIGGAAVELYRDGDVHSTPVPWTRGSATGTGPKSRRLKVEVRGDMLRYFVDDTLVGEVKNELKGTDWSIGVGACGKQSVRFDRLVVTER
jgi:hypothetical protein